MIEEPNLCRYIIGNLPWRVLVVCIFFLEYLINIMIDISRLMLTDEENLFSIKNKLKIAGLLLFKARRFFLLDSVTNFDGYVDAMLTWAFQND